MTQFTADSATTWKEGEMTESVRKSTRSHLWSVDSTVHDADTLHSTASGDV